MSDSPISDDRNRAEELAKHWQKLINEIPALGTIDSYEKFVSWRIQNTRYDIPLTMWTYKELYDVVKAAPEEETEQPGESKNKPQGHKKEHHGGGHTSIDPFWFQAVDENGKQVAEIEKDRRMTRLKEHLTEAWKQEHPEGDAKAYTEYFNFHDLAPKTPLDAFFSIDREEAQVEKDARAWLRQIDPKAVEQYEKNEEKQIYSDAGRDRLFRREIVKLKKSVGEQFATWEKEGQTKTEVEKYTFIVGAQLKSMDAFAKRYPEKAVAYAKNSGYIAKALEIHNLGREITDEDIKELVDPEGLRYFSSLFHPEKATTQLPIPLIPEDTGINPDDYIITRKIINMPSTSEDDGIGDEEIGDEYPDGYDDVPESGRGSDEEQSEDEEQQQGVPREYPRQRMLNRANNMIDRARGIKNTAKNLGKLGKIGKAAGAGQAGQGATGLAATVEIWGPIALILFIIIVIIILIVILLSNAGKARDVEAIPLEITKSGPTAVENCDPANPSICDVTYTIVVKSGGKASDIVVTDVLPPDTEFIKASGQYSFRDNTVTWSLASQIGTPSANTGPQPTNAQAFDTSKYASAPYNLPIPNGPSDAIYSDDDIQKLNKLGSVIGEHQTYLQSKVKNNDTKYIDPFIAVIWSGAIEGTRGNNYSWNCQDKYKDINIGCTGGYYSGGWQVSYGIQVYQGVSHLAEDFEEIYGQGSANDPEKVRQAGQAVIDNSTLSSKGQITNPSTFPSETISNLKAKAQANDVAAQQAIALLLMDPKVGALSITREVAQDIASRDDWRGTMEGWGSYYRTNMQKFANRMQEIATKYTGSAVGSFYTETLTITLRPTKPNIYIVNQATAQAFGGYGEATPTQEVTNPDLAPPSDENCSGVYGSQMQGNPTGKNFGDPQCTLAPNGVINESKVAEIVTQLDGPNANVWLSVIIPCIGGFNPNSYFPDNGGEWGMFGLGGSSNSSLSGGFQGDVPWTKQIKNAIEYNKELEKAGKQWEYWKTNCPAVP
jgi:uncharacterized repeat protein (TIGR01451 family)